MRASPIRVGMLRRAFARQDGFTLVEILVVLLILAVLAAIALPQFLGQTEKAQDADAKSLARNLMTQVEACYAETRSYSECDSAADLPKTSFQWGDGSHARDVQVLVRPFGQNMIAFAATSETKTSFAIAHGLDDRDVVRVCLVPSNAYPTGACHQGGAFAGFGTW